MAKLFDQNPIKSVKNIKFFTKKFEDEYVDDILGKTACDAVLKVISEDEELLKIWEGFENDKK